MAYKVQYKVKGSIVVEGDKYPYNQIHNVTKKRFEYLQKTFPDKFKFFEDKPKPKPQEEVEKRAEEKPKFEGKGYIKKSAKR